MLYENLCKTLQSNLKSKHNKFKERINLMRTLEYEVTGQQIKPVGDHSGIVSGSIGYLKAQFKFSEEWDDCVKVASFFYDGDEYAKKLDEENSCEIPPEALKGLYFEVSVEGRKLGYRIPSRRIKERQIGGGK